MVRIVAASVALAINWTSYVWCVTHGRVIETALGYFLSPIGLVVAGVVVYHEHLRTAQRVALGLAGGRGRRARRSGTAHRRCSRCSWRRRGPRTAC